MRSGSAWLAALLCACGGSSTEPAPVTPAPIPEPAELPEESEGSDRPDAEPSAPSADEVKALEVVSSLAAVPAIAYYMPEVDAILVAEIRETEGQGSSATAVLMDKGNTGQILSSWTITGAADAIEDGQRKLATQLAGKKLVALPFTDWPQGKRSVEVASPAMVVSWQKSGKLTARTASKTVTIGHLAVKGATKDSRPAGVFASPDSPVALIRFQHRIEGKGSTGSMRFDRP